MIELGAVVHLVIAHLRHFQQTSYIAAIDLQLHSGLACVFVFSLQETSTFGWCPKGGGRTANTDNFTELDHNLFF